MIHVDRSSVPAPEALTGRRAAQELKKAEDFYRNLMGRRGQERFYFTLFRDRSVTEALIQLFHGKCAYCEAKVIYSSPIDVEQFRPKSGVTESPNHPGYWWLALDWNNLLASCADCNRIRIQEGVKSGKANRFPLADEKKRVFTPHDDLSAETPLLLNPCVDHPEKHLVFNDDGGVVSETPRGQTTIAVLGLNRPGLRKARSAQALRIKAALRNIQALIRLSKSDSQADTEVLKHSLGELMEMTGPEAEFAGMNRQLIMPALDKLPNFRPSASPAQSWQSDLPRHSKAKVQQVTAAFHEFEVEQSDFSLADKQGQEKYRSRRRHIEKITLTNFKGIESLEIDLGTSSGRTRWLMLLGENSTGKSSVLQAVAMTLAGAKYFADVLRKRRLKLRDYIHYDASEAKVDVRLSGFVASHRLTLGPSQAVFRNPNGDEVIVKPGRGAPKVKTNKSRSADAQVVLIAYGATRLLPRDKSVAYGCPFARIDNLFDPFLPLFDAEKWLRKLKGQPFDDVALVLKDLLALDEDAEIAQRKDQLVVRMNGDDVPLRQLSDGYQAAIAMSVDILEVVKRLWPNVAEAEGIVLLDEIGSHLHPVWKMRIVESLRHAFPGMQFIATTHEPLCLRGLGEGEAVVMRRDASRRIEAVTGLPSPSDFRIDQLLTSEYFGLNSTVDADTEKLFDEYYALLAMPKHTKPQSERLAWLQANLKDRRYFGNTLREQLMYEALDRLVAEQRLKSRPVPQLKQAAVDAIAEIWNSPLPDVEKAR